MLPTHVFQVPSWVLFSACAALDLVQATEVPQLASWLAPYVLVSGICCCCSLTPACGSLCPQGSSVVLNGECSFGAILCGALACLSGWWSLLHLLPTCPHTSLLSLLQPLAGQRNFVKGCSSDNDTWLSWSFVSRDVIPQ